MILSILILRQSGIPLLYWDSSGLGFDEERVMIGGFLSALLDFSTIVGGEYLRGITFENQRYCIKTIRDVIFLIATRRTGLFFVDLVSERIVLDLVDEFSEIWQTTFGFDEEEIVQDTGFYDLFKEIIMRKIWILKEQNVRELAELCEYGVELLPASASEVLKKLQGIPIDITKWLDPGVK